tara:strand:+ start:92 stop:1396 length:1305 start_codon:yes stop_codon:yes gene_type:complete
MTTLKTRDGKGITFTGTCTEVISIDDVVEHSANKAWRSNSEKSVVEEKNDLYDSIKTQGLREPITMYEGSKIIISGHTRIEQLRQLGVTEVPINRLPRTENMPAEGEIDPMHDDVIREHAISNTRVNTTVFGRYSYAREIMAARVDGFNIDLKTSDHNMPRKQYLEIIKTAGIGDDSFKLIEDIRFGYSKTYKDKDCFVEARSDLYDDLKNPAKDYAVRQLYKWQWEAFRVANFNDAFPQQDFMDDTLDTLNFNNVINAVYNNLASIEAAALTDEYPGINWFNDTDDNYISATVHHMIGAFTCIELNKVFEECGFDARAEQAGNQGHYDILIKDRDNNDISSLEVKTTFGKTKWSSGSNKTGYGLFFAYNKERERFFAVSTFVGETEWTDMGKGAFEMRVETLYNKDDNEVKYYLGDIEVDNDVYRIQKYKVTQ